MWNVDDVMAIYRSQFGDGPRYKALDIPAARYGFPHADEVRDQDGTLVGLSRNCGYSSNEGALLSLATLEPAHAEPGTEVVVTWGEPGGGSRKPQVEPHEQVKVRATVAPAPYAAAVNAMRQATLQTARPS